MLKKTFTYTDYNGVERTETHYFNLSKAELVDMEATTPGSLSEKLKRIVDGADGPEIMKFFKELIFKSYGIKSDDGRRFIKSKELSEGFAQTEAYSQIFMELATDADAAAKFVNGIVPADLAQKAALPNT